MPVAAVYSCELEHAWMNNMEVEYLFPQSSSSKGKLMLKLFYFNGILIINKVLIVSKIKNFNVISQQNVHR